MMLNPNILKFVEHYALLSTHLASWSKPNLQALAEYTLPAPSSKPCVFIISPHPDDECIIGGLALRLQQELNYRIINVAATLGSKVERRAQRWQELRQACKQLNFELIAPPFSEDLPLTLYRKQTDQISWQKDVNQLLHLLNTYQPDIIFCPHKEDGSQTHIGTHQITIDALKYYKHPIYLVQTEFWSNLKSPNILLELSNQHVAQLIQGLCCHQKEIERNPYHLRLPAWFSDSVRRGGEIIFGAGSMPPPFPFGALYQIDLLIQCNVQHVIKKQSISQHQPLQDLFTQA